MGANYLIFQRDLPIKLGTAHGGAETATLWLARELANKGNRVILAAELPEGEETRWGVEFWNYGDTYDVGTILKRARSLGPYHLLSACRAQPILEARHEELCQSLTFMAHDPSGNSTGVRSTILAKVADNLVCVSEAQKALFVEQGVAPQDIKVVYNGANHDVFSAGNVEQRDWKRIVFVGALVADKGIDILIRSFASILQKHPAATLDVYGSSEMWKREPFFDHKPIAAQLPAIKFHGAVTPEVIAEAFRGAGMCIIPSRWFDSFPLTAVEAQISGCPVVAFNVGGVREIVKHNQTGVLIPEITEGALAYAMDSLLSSPQELKRLSINALQEIRPRFSWGVTADRIIELCQQSSPSLSVFLSQALLNQ